jgi:hypothetical protein
VSLAILIDIIDDPGFLRLASPGCPSAFSD